MKSTSGDGGGRVIPAALIQLVPGEPTVLLSVSLSHCCFLPSAINKLLFFLPSFLACPLFPSLYSSSLSLFLLISLNFLHLVCLHFILYSFITFRLISSAMPFLFLFLSSLLLFFVLFVSSFLLSCYTFDFFPTFSL